MTAKLGWGFEESAAPDPQTPNQTQREKGGAGPQRRVAFSRESATGVFRPLPTRREQPCARHGAPRGSTARNDPFGITAAKFAVRR